MKLDVGQLKFLSREDFRVLLAVELGQKNHELVPVPLIDSIAGLKHGGTVKRLKVLLRAKLVHHESMQYDGYRLTYLGYDYLAIKTLLNRGLITSIGRQIGVGKEADVFEAMNEDGEVLALKLHRLGRTSFRAVKAKRDYLKHRSSFSWLYLSRLAAVKEFAFMKALGDHGFPVPKGIDNNRHVVLMELVDAFPLVQVREVQNPGFVYRQCIDIMARLTAKGLIHCDFNEFNLLIDDDENITLIDFPQMVSVGHGNARELFHRDVECIIRFFKKKLGYIPEHDPDLPYVRPDFEKLTAEMDGDISTELRASGFEREHQLTLEEWAAQQPTETLEGENPTDELANRLSELAADHSSEELEAAAKAGESSNDESANSDAESLGRDAESSGRDAESADHEARNNLELRKGDGDEALSTPEEDSEAAVEAERGMAEPAKGVFSQGLDGAAAFRKQLPSEGAVQERLVAEMRRSKQSNRMRSAAKSVRKSSASKSKRKGSGVDY